MISIDTTMIKYKTVNFVEAEGLLKTKAGILNPQLSKPNMSKVFNLNDGTMLTIGKKACYIYNSEEDVVRLLNGAKTSEHMLYNLNYYGQKLPRMVEESKKKIVQLLNVDIKKLNYSEESLSYIDHAIMVSFLEKKIDEEDILENVIYFIAYSGQTFNLVHQGSWLMVLDEDGETWQPYNILNGKRVDLFPWVYSSLCELIKVEIPSISAGYQAKINNFLKKK